jgi:hypothetical protein
MESQQFPELVFDRVENEDRLIALINGHKVVIDAASDYYPSKFFDKKVFTYIGQGSYFSVNGLKQDLKHKNNQGVFFYIKNKRLEDPFQKQDYEPLLKQVGHI